VWGENVGGPERGVGGGGVGVGWRVGGSCEGGWPLKGVQITITRINKTPEGLVVQGGFGGWRSFWGGGGGFWGRGGVLGKENFFYNFQHLCGFFFLLLSFLVLS